MNSRDILLHLNPWTEIDKNDEVTLISVEEIKDNKCQQDGIKINFKHSYDNKIRTLDLYTDLDIDENNLISGKLNGFIYNQKEYEEDFPENTSDYQIEMIRTYLQKEITISFENEYEEKPGIIVNIDKKYESLYRTFSLEYLKTNDVFKGVKITFNSLKFKTVYPAINIIIIGDKDLNKEDISNYLFYDKATSRSYLNDYTSTDNLILSRDVNGTTLTNHSSTSQSFTSSFSSIDNVIIEFKMERLDLVGTIIFGYKGADIYLTNNYVPVNSEHNIKMICTNNELKLYVDNELKNTETTSSSDMKMVFKVQNSRFRFKDLKIYALS